MSETIKANTIYDTISRKGSLTVRFLTDFEKGADTFVDAEIIEGTTRYMSAMNQALQAETGQGTEGDTITMRASLLTLGVRRYDLEKARAALAQASPAASDEGGQT